MSVLKGTMNYLRFRVQTHSKHSIDALEQAVAMRRFIPLHPQGEDLESYGWVSFQRPYADDLALTNDLFLFGERVVLGFRLDTIAYPKALVKDMLFRKCEEHERQMGQKPSFRAQRMLELSVISELRGKILPKTKVAEWVFDMQRQELRLFARGQAISERFQKLFSQTFQVEITPISFVAQAMAAELPLREKAFLETLSHQPIFRTKHITEA